MSDIKLAMDFIKQVKMDCDNQADAILNNDDLAWNVRDKENWDSISENLDKAIKLLEKVI